MKLFKNWFGVKEVEVPELTKIELKPEIEIPAEVRRQLYESAVREVQLLRVDALVYLALETLVYGQKAVDDTTRAFNRAKDCNKANRVPLSVDRLKEEYPDAILRKVYTDSSHSKVATLSEGDYNFDLPKISAKDISKALAIQYLSE